MDKFGQIIGALGGKKFLMALVGVAAITLKNKFGIDENTVYTIGGLIATYILTQGGLDAVTGGITSSTTAPVDLAEMKRIALATEIEKSRQIELEVQKAKAVAVPPPAVPLEQQIIDAASRTVRRDVQ